MSFEIRGNGIETKVLSRTKTERGAYRAMARLAREHPELRTLTLWREAPSMTGKALIAELTVYSTEEAEKANAFLAEHPELLPHVENRK